MAGKKPVHVTPHEEGWAVRRKRASRARRTHRTQADAERAGRGTARRDQTEFVLHGRDGPIPDRDGYGNDPNPPYGRPWTRSMLGETAMAAVLRSLCGL